MRTSVKRMIPRAESPSKVLFPSSHPSVRENPCNPWSKNILLDFVLNFEQFLAER